MGSRSKSASTTLSAERLLVSVPVIAMRTWTAAVSEDVGTGTGAAVGYAVGRGVGNRVGLSDGRLNGTDDGGGDGISVIVGAGVHPSAVTSAQQRTTTGA